MDPQTNKPFQVIQGGAVRPVDDKVMPFLKSEEHRDRSLPSGEQLRRRNWIDISGFLRDEDARAEFRQEVAAFLASDKYRGLMVDFEDISQEGTARLRGSSE